MRPEPLKTDQQILIIRGCTVTIPKKSYLCPHLKICTDSLKKCNLEEYFEVNVGTKVVDFEL